MDRKYAILVADEVSWLAMGAAVCHVTRLSGFIFYSGLCKHYCCLRNWVGFMRVQIDGCCVLACRNADCM
jgi:hypothetical protein